MLLAPLPPSALCRCAVRRLHAARHYQTHAHPQLFSQAVQLTDGSTVRIVSVSPPRPLLKLNVDSLVHPSWNPASRNRMLLTEHGEVSKFKERFSAMDESSLDSFEGLLGSSSGQPTAKVGIAKTKKNKT